MSPSDPHRTDDGPVGRDPDLQGFEPIRTARIESLSDGVFSIAMTLLVLPIEVPEVIPEGPLGPVRAVAAMWPAWVGYVATFVILGGYWIGQHAQFQLIRRADHGLLWGTLVFLLFVAALPFSASLVGHHLWAPGAVSIYCAHLVAIGVSHYAVWRHATAGHLLVDARMPNATVRRHVALALVAPVAYALAIPLAFVSTLAALAVCIVVPVVYVLVPHALAAERPGGRPRP